MSRFETSLEHLLAEAKRIDLMLRLRATELRLQRGDANWDELRGLYISEAEIEDLLSSALHCEPSPTTASPDDGPIGRLVQALSMLEEEISERRSGALNSGVELRLERLKQVFDLTASEVDSLLICLLPELDLKYQRLFAYLQDDVTKKAPTVDLVTKVLAGSIEDRTALRVAFEPQGRLLGSHLLLPYDSQYARGGFLLETAFKVDQRVIDYLLGGNRIDARLCGFCKLADADVALSDMMLPEELKERLVNLLQGDLTGCGAIFYMQGPYGAGKQTAAEAMCRELGMPLLVVDVDRMLAADLSGDLALSLIFREAWLQQACLYWDGFDHLLGDDRSLKIYRDGILERSGEKTTVVFLGSRLPWEPAGDVAGKPFLRVELPVPTYGIREQLWQTHLNGHVPMEADVDLGAVANKFRFTGGQIRDAVAAARYLAVGRVEGERQIGMDDLYQACRAQSNQKLNSLARKIQPRFTWDDIVLPRDQMAQLHEIRNYVRYKHVVYGNWNFEHKLSLGRGLNVLFAGPSGTGKTMAAEIMAGDLKLDLYKIDLSTVVSKYIGETEKNLDRIFREAQDSNAILFFDEADAIFGKRSEVRDSHDRYANIEIAYLLQKMEEYDGIVILATNLRKNLDEAFARRMHFSVEFPLPEEADRLRIWQRVFPKAAPVSEEVDFSFMARQFKVTGGNIKNIALSAAFLAADDGGTINIEHLIRATKREYQKMGRLCTEVDFAQYFDLVKG